MSNPSDVPSPEEFFNSNQYPPSEEFYANVLHLFFDKGIGYNEFKELPLPYIFLMIKKHHEKMEEMDKNT